MSGVFDRYIQSEIDAMCIYVDKEMEHDPSGIKRENELYIEWIEKHAREFRKNYYDRESNKDKGS